MSNAPLSLPRVAPPGDWGRNTKWRRRHLPQPPLPFSSPLEVAVRQGCVAPVMGAAGSCSQAPVRGCMEEGGRVGGWSPSGEVVLDLLPSLLSPARPCLQLGVVAGGWVLHAADRAGTMDAGRQPWAWYGIFLETNIFGLCFFGK
jgi:hypothetical protein